MAIFGSLKFQMRSRKLAEIRSDESEFRRAEYAALRSEIDRRSEAQFNLIALTLTAFGTLAGIALAAPQGSDKTRLLLLLPIFCACTGFLWLDHDGAIQEIGDYVRDELWPADLPTFEVRADRRARSASISLEFVAPVLLVFTVPAFAGLWINQHDQDPLWTVGALTTSSYFLYGVWRFVKRRAAASEKED